MVKNRKGDVWGAILLLLVCAVLFCACTGANEIGSREDEITPREETVGTLYSLQEAYDKGFLTKADILHIVYFLNDSVFEVIPVTVDGEVWARDDFVPQIETPALSMLYQKIINDMKMAFYEKHRQGLNDAIQWLEDNGYRDKGDKVIDSISVFSFLGEYNDSFAIRISSNLIEHGTGNFTENVASIEWDQFGLPVTIYRALSKEEKDE